MKNSRRKIAVLIICRVAVIGVISGSLAWYSSTNSITQIGTLAGFRTKANVYLQDESGNKINLQKDENGLFILSADPSAENYVGNLRVNVIHRGYANSYVRVKMSVQWTMLDGTVTQNILLPYTFADGWYDNRDSDYCVYYTEDTGLFEDYDKSIITAFNSEKFAQETMTKDAVAKLAVSVESIQINRYQQVWGIETLPWE